LSAGGTQSMRRRKKNVNNVCNEEEREVFCNTHIMLLLLQCEVLRETILLFLCTEIGVYCCCWRAKALINCIPY